MAGPALPAWLQNDAADNLAQRISDNLPKSQPPYVSIEGNRFTLVDAAGDEDMLETLYLDCCILDVNDHISKIWYEKEYAGRQASSAPPDCWSDNGVAPSRQAAKPQSSTCQGCPKNEWGSAISKMSGKGIKWCKDYYKLALALPDDDIIFLLRVPPNSLSNLEAYTEKFRGQNVGMSAVITRIQFVPGVQGTLTFQAVSYIDEATAKLRADARARKATDSIVGRTDKPREGLPAPQPAAQIQGPAASPQAPAQTVASPSTPMAPPQTQTAQPAPAASPSEAPRRRRRTKAEMEAAGTGATAQAPTQAPFRPTEPPATAGGNSGAPFGISPGVAPNPELQATLDGLGMFSK